MDYHCQQWIGFINNVLYAVSRYHFLHICPCMRASFFVNHSLVNFAQGEDGQLHIVVIDQVLLAQFGRTCVDMHLICGKKPIPCPKL